MRTRARRMTGEAFIAARTTNRADGIPRTPTPIPDDLKTSFTDGFGKRFAGFLFFVQLPVGHGQEEAVVVVAALGQLLRLLQGGDGFLPLPRPVPRRA